MLVIGSTELTSKLERGSFFCPQCECRHGYHLKSKRPFLTLYFIPVIPIGAATRFVECLHCHYHFPEDLLYMSDELEAAATSGNFFTDVKRIMILMMIADGTVSEEEIAAIQQFYEEITGERVTREDVEDEVAMANSAKSTVVEYIRRIAPSLEMDEKEILVEAAFLVATATGELHAAQEEQLGGMPKALGITQTRFRAIVNQVLEAEEEAIG